MTLERKGRMKSATGCSHCATECYTVPTVGHGFSHPREGRILRDIDLGSENLKRGTIVIKAVGISSEGFAFLVIHNKLVRIPEDCIEWLPMNDDERDHVL